MSVRRGAECSTESDRQCRSFTAARPEQIYLPCTYRVPELWWRSPCGAVVSLAAAWANFATKDIAT